MNKKIAFLIVLGIFFGLAVFGYFNAVPAPQDEAVSRPQIEMAPLSFDFGDVQYGQVAEHAFKIKNLGSEILEIKKIATSCACTSAEASKEKINPQEEADLLVTYNTGLMSGSHAKGEQERIIYIKTNDPINPQVEVVIHAYVK